MRLRAADQFPQTSAIHGDLLGGPVFARFRERLLDLFTEPLIVRLLHSTIVTHPLADAMGI